jgi:hypothetical protein
VCGACVCVYVYYLYTYINTYIYTYINTYINICRWGTWAVFREREREREREMALCRWGTWPEVHAEGQKNVFSIECVLLLGLRSMRRIAARFSVFSLFVFSTKKTHHSLLDAGDVVLGDGHRHRGW